MDFLLSMIQMFGCNFAPRGWVQCNGQQLSIAQNTALFSLLGTSFGGNGQTTFGIPDFRGRTPIGTGQGPGLTNRSLGDLGGFESATLTTNQLPAHTHTNTATSTSTMYAETAAGDARNPQGNMLATAPASGPIYAAPAPALNKAMAPDAITTATTVTIAPTGGSQPVGLVQPFLAVTVCICTEGIFPSRN